MASTYSRWINLIASRRTAPYLFIAPFFVLFLSFWIYPVFYSLYLSFFSATGLGPRTFVALDNYTRLIRDGRFIRSVVNTSTYAAASVFILAPLALLVALALNSSHTRYTKNVYRLVYFIPVITSGVVIGIMFGVVFDFAYGLLNNFIARFGIEPIPWIRSSRWALRSVILLGIWIWLGLNSLYFLAGLQNIPNEFYESAIIDGANAPKRFRFITLPMLRPVTMFVVIQAIIGSYILFDQVWVLTSGGPQDSTLTMTIYLYLIGFRQFRLGYASAIAYSLVFIVLGLTLAVILLFRQFGDEI